MFDSLFAILIAGATTAVPFLTNYITKFATQQNISMVINISVILVGLIAIRILATFYTSYYGHIMGLRIEVSMRQDAVKKMHRLTRTHYDNTNSGTFVSRIIHDLRDIAEFAHHAPEDLIVGVLSAAGALSYAFIYS